MSIVRDMIDSAILILIGYSLFEILDKVISSIILRFPVSYNLFEFSKMALISAYSLFIKGNLSYYVILAFIVVIILTFVEITMAENIKGAAVKQFFTVIFLYLFAGDIYKFFLLLSQPVSGLNVSGLLDFRTNLFALIVLYIFMILITIFYMRLSQLLSYEEEEEEIVPAKRGLQY